jgi:hypothetical protein
MRMPFLLASYCPPKKLASFLLQKRPTAVQTLQRCLSQAKGIFHIVKVIVAILRASVRRAIVGRMQLLIEPLDSNLHSVSTILASHSAK